MTITSPEEWLPVCFTTNASQRPGHHVIVPRGQSPYPAPPLPMAAQEHTP